MHGFSASGGSTARVMSVFGGTCASADCAQLQNCRPLLATDRATRQHDHTAITTAMTTKVRRSRTIHGKPMRTNTTSSRREKNHMKDARNFKSWFLLDDFIFNFLVDFRFSPLTATSSGAFSPSSL